MTCVTKGHQPGMNGFSDAEQHGGKHRVVQLQGPCNEKLRGAHLRRLFMRYALRLYPYDGALLPQSVIVLIQETHNLATSKKPHINESFEKSLIE